MAATQMPVAASSVKPTWLDRLPPGVKKALEPLSPYERRFVQLYCGECRGNGTMAMQMLRRKLAEQSKQPGRKAKRQVKEVTYSTASSMASQILTRPSIRVAIATWMDSFALSAAEVTYKIADRAQANMSPFVRLEPVARRGRAKKGKRGAQLPAQQWHPVLKVDDPDAWLNHQHWIKRIRTHGKTGRIIEIELHDAAAADKELARILKLTSDQPPILALHLHFQQMSDEQVLAELERAYDEIATAKHGDDARLPAGEPVAVVDPTGVPPTTKKEKHK